MSKLSFTQRRKMIREFKRVNFIYSCSGYDATIEFVKRGVPMYNDALATGYGKSYDSELRASVLAYIIVLLNQDK